LTQINQHSNFFTRFLCLFFALFLFGNLVSAQIYVQGNVKIHVSENTNLSDSVVYIKNQNKKSKIYIVEGTVHNLDKLSSVEITKISNKEKDILDEEKIILVKQKKPTANTEKVSVLKPYNYKNKVVAFPFNPRELHFNGAPNSTLAVLLNQKIKFAVNEKIDKLIFDFLLINIEKLKIVNQYQTYKFNSYLTLFSVRPPPFIV